MAIEYVKRKHSAPVSAESDWGQSPPWGTPNEKHSEGRSLVPEPGVGAVVRFRVGSYKFAAVRVENEGAGLWYTTASECGEHYGEWGVGDVTTWDRICTAATGQIEIACDWKALIAKDE